MRWGKPQSLFAQLLLFLGLPLVLLWGLSAFNSYVSALQAATQAYDRTRRPTGGECPLGGAR